MMRALCRGLPILLLVCLAPGLAPAQVPDIRPLLTGHRVVRAVYGDGLVFAGLQRGGVALWDPDDRRTLGLLDRADGLGGHFVQDLAWVDGTLWIATQEGGLTALRDAASPQREPEVFSSLLSSLDVTAVCGQIVGVNEKIYYGTAGQGIGVINDGLEGAYYTEQDGLIDDRIVALAVSGDVLLAATPSGLSRFAGNVFTSHPYASQATESVRALATAPDGTIWAATAGGVRRWNDQERTLEHVFGDESFTGLVSDGSSVWALAASGVYRDQGAGFQAQDLPAAPAGTIPVPEALAAGGGRAWYGGRLRTAGLSFYSAARAWLAEVGDAGGSLHVLPTCEIGVDNGFCGVAFDGQGRPWLGDFFGDGLASFADGAWRTVDTLASAENDGQGLFNHEGFILVMARAGDAVWFAQTGYGVIRFRPASGEGEQDAWDLMTPDNSGLRGTSFVAIEAHPDGPIFFCTDDSEGHTDLGVDVLLDPQNWQLASSWLHLGPDRLAGGNNVWAVGFEERDVVWFGVRQQGLLRWDVNGPLTGATDPLLWDDDPDNWLDQPLNLLTGSSIELKGTNAIAVGPDGSIWAGGTGGLVNFLFTSSQQAVFLGEWEAKTQAQTPGLLAQLIVGMQLDRNDHLWVLTAAGLNRLRLDAQPLQIDAYTDLNTYLGLGGGGLYALSSIQPLPGPSYHHLAATADGARLVLSGSRGGALVDIPRTGSGGQGAAEQLVSAYLYPNPFPGPSGQDRLGLGGLDLAEGLSCSIEILDLSGQLVYSRSGVTNLDDVWDGRNREGRRVAGGLYVVKIALGGQSALRTLAVAP